MSHKEDEQYFFEQGEAFLLPTVLLYNADGGTIYDLGLPAFTVCEAFGTEAYLKSLIKLQTGDAALRTHNLKKLFELLSPDAQAAIRKEWMVRHAPGVLNVPPGNAPDGTPYETKVVESFEEALDLSSQAFLKWRYDFHDHHAWYMRALGYLVRRQVLKLRPEWMPVSGSYFTRIDPHPDFSKQKL